MSAEKRRKVLARWVMTGNLTLTTASQIGMQDSESADSTFARDARGRVVLPGTTLGGALRSALEDILIGYRQCDRARLGQLFGDLSKHESPLMVFDAVADPGTVAATIRDGVRIDPKSRLAADGLKYDRELALPGLQFPIRLELIVPEDTKVWASEASLLADLCAALEALSGGHIRFGARKSRGLGACRVSDWRAKRFSLTTLDEWKTYAKIDHENPLAGEPAHSSIAQALSSQPGGHFTRTEVEDKRSALRLEFDCTLPGTLLIRTPGVGASDPDMVHLTEKGRQLLSGTSLAGALRAHCGRIVNTMDWDAALTDTLFGSAPDPRQQTLTASRVQVSEAIIQNGTSRKQTRVKIDRFTGGALDTALFDQQPAIGGTVKFLVRCLAPDRRQIGLLLLAARDLIEGLLALAGEASVGRGMLHGSVTAHFPDSSPPVKLTRGVALDADTVRRLDAYLSEASA